MGNVSVRFFLILSSLHKHFKCEYYKAENMHKIQIWCYGFFFLMSMKLHVVLQMQKEWGGRGWNLTILLQLFKEKEGSQYIQWVFSK